MTTKMSMLAQGPEPLAWQSFLSDVFSDRAVDRRTWHRAGQELPSFRDWPWATFAGPGVARRFRIALDHQRQPSARDLAECASWGALRAEQGVPIEEAMHVFHLYRSELNRRASEVRGASDTASRMLLSDLSAEWLDGGLIAALKAYRATADERRPVDGERHTALLRSMLIEGIAPLEASGELERYGLDPSRWFYAVRGRATAETGSVTLRAYFSDTADTGGRTLVGCLEGDICGILEQLPTDPAPVPVGVSEAVPVTELAHAFARASRAHATALALGRVGVHDLASLGVYPSILSDGDVREALVARYIAPLGALGTLGSSVLETVEHYLRADCALGTTASDLCLHVNSVRYRLRKYEEITKCSLRSSEALAEVWWALASRALIGDQVPSFNYQPMDQKQRRPGQSDL